MAKSIRTINDARAAILAKLPRSCRVTCFAYFTDYRFEHYRDCRESYHCDVDFDNNCPEERLRGRKLEIRAEKPTELVTLFLKALASARELCGRSEITPRPVPRPEETESIEGRQVKRLEQKVLRLTDQTIAPRPAQQVLCLTWKGEQSNER